MYTDSQRDIYYARRLIYRRDTARHLAVYYAMKENRGARAARDLYFSAVAYEQERFRTHLAELGC